VNNLILQPLPSYPQKIPSMKAGRREIGGGEKKRDISLIFLEYSIEPERSIKEGKKKRKGERKKGISFYGCTPPLFENTPTHGTAEGGREGKKRGKGKGYETKNFRHRIPLVSQMTVGKGGGGEEGKEGAQCSINAISVRITIRNNRRKRKDDLRGKGKGSPESLIN